MALCQYWEGQLDWTGLTAWPGLADGPGSSQHLIGDLSLEDCDDYLARRLVQDRRPLISPDIRAASTARSYGLPLHLDLAVGRFLEIRRTREPLPQDFDHAFPALLARVLSDLTPEERHLLRSISLLDAFDLDLATQAAGLTHQAPPAAWWNAPSSPRTPTPCGPITCTAPSARMSVPTTTATTDGPTPTGSRPPPAPWPPSATSGPPPTRAPASAAPSWSRACAKACAWPANTA
ncbi:hypothetical protein [Streptomyces sp. NBC_01197]|uniref:hypothetical protein n=1 Tax=Streptomyces sp. NBC_01197 TaxID=2903768 RepID=UPI002E10D976|nr:hypothetical protein OG452_34345 [Streptomyces sp. NBC_01197]